MAKSNVDQGTGDFEFDLIGGDAKPFQSYVSAQDKTIVNERCLVRGSKNVYKGLTGRVVARCGLKLRGLIDNTNAGVQSSYEWPTSVGNIRVLRLCNGKMQVESDIVTPGAYLWYDLQNGVTLTRHVFDTVWDNTLKKDFLVFVRGDSNLFRWDGGVGMIASTTANTIVLSSDAIAQGFRTSGGSLLVNGHAYTYAGITGSTLTGVAGDPTGEANGSVVVETPITNATKPAVTPNDFLRVIVNRVHIGSYTSRLVYISSQYDYTNYTVPATRAVGDPEIITIDSLARGIAVRQGLAHIFGGTADMYIVSYSQISNAGVIVERTDIDHRVIDNLGAPFGHEFIDNVGDDIVWLDQNTQLRVYGTFRNLSEPVYPTLSLPIKDELQSVSFAGGHLRAIGESIFITSPLTGVTYWYETRTSINLDGLVFKERLWHPPQVWNISRFALINGVIYAHSNSTPQIYQVFNTGQWSDDGNILNASGIPTAIPYDCVMAMAYRKNRRAQGMTNFNRMYFEGYISGGTELNVTVLYDYQGTRGKTVKVLNSVSDPAPLFGQGYGASIGDSSLGDAPLGDGITPDEAMFPKFKRVKTPSPVDCFEYQIVVSSSAIDSRWEMLYLGTNATQSPHQAVFISY